jgi:ribosome-associated heat shock protein Hsp15
VTQRVDIWLHRARLARTRAVATDLVATGGLRLVRGGLARRLEKASSLVSAGDVLVFRRGAGLRTVEIIALAERRGPAAEARALYRDLEARFSDGQDSVA